MIEIEFLELAQKELDESFVYYEGKQNGLGYRFIEDITMAIDLIQTYPFGWSKVSKNTRRCLLKRFPYGVIYQKRDDKILVIAIANLYKKPNYWVNRIKK